MSNADKLITAYENRIGIDVTGARGPLTIVNERGSVTIDLQEDGEDFFLRVIERWQQQGKVTWSRGQEIFAECSAELRKRLDAPVN